ncbi:HPr family phosphocarrier protein [Peribacillus sp. NJ11]|uniref:HPr family phosphocarrier protein n=1 Tax=Peribacillus sp. NJ11 TaxID=3055861 RepID=UPI0025A13C79|nr:HPr family phosphocarrier protein [Peribacillus sp. NJ11]MDM5224037.1 HPr family phosphocarrier protein [Peribacillus sp. NJ11]
MELATSFNGEIMIIFFKKSLSAKSIIGVVGAAISPSDEIKLISGDNDDNKPIKIIQDILSIERNLYYFVPHRW